MRQREANSQISAEIRGVTILASRLCMYRDIAGHEDLTERIIQCGIKVHEHFGPGLLESVYKTCVAFELREAGFKVDTTRRVPLVYKSLNLSPNETAYLWVGAVPSGQRRIAIFHINRENGHATWRSTANRAGWCSSPAGFARSISAVHLNAMPECVQTNNFYSTPMKSMGSSAIQLASTSAAILSDAAYRAMAHRGGLWFSCSLGCCEGTDFTDAVQ